MSVKVKHVLDALQQMQKSLECSICLELLKDPHSTKCNHQFCGQCIRQVLEKSSKKSKNKWYCPLCKTPVSKRSLTPNPKLNEIVAAVRNLQGAVQDDTGIPTGSPPSQQFKSCLAGGTGGDVGSDHSSSVHQIATPQKSVTDDSGRQTVLRKNQFNVYIDNNDNEQSLESKQPSVITNTNIRSSLRPPALCETATKSAKSKKVANTTTIRKTRNSRRIAQDNNTKEMNDKNANEDLLHMIDTMSFKPVPHGGSTCSSGEFILVPNTLDTKIYQTSVTSDKPSPISTKTAVAMDDKDTDCNSASVHQERTACLTTKAEADSSIRTSITHAETLLCRNKNFVPFQNAGNSKEDEGAVSSTKCESVSQSSLDTMQSVSILQSLEDCFEQQCEAVPSDVCDEKNQEGGYRHNEDSIRRVAEENKLVSDEICHLEVQDKSCNEKPAAVCEDHLEKESHGNEGDVCESGKDSRLVSTKICGTENKDETSDALLESVFDQGKNEDGHQNESITFQGDEAGIVTLTERSRCDPESQENPCDAVLNSVSGESQGRSDHGRERNEGDKLISIEPGDPGKLKEPFETYQERHSNSQRLSQPAGTTLPSEKFLSSVKDYVEQSLDFEGLVSVSDDPSLAEPLETITKAEPVKKGPGLGKPENESISPHMEGRGQVDLQENGITDSSDSCERVKQRQRPSERPLNLNRQSNSSKRSARWKTKTKKRSADSVVEFQEFDEPSPNGIATKRFKPSEGPSPGYTSPVMANMSVGKSQNGVGVSDERQKPNKNLTTEESDALEIDSYPCSSGRTVLSSEVVPPSVSSSDKSSSAVINPMIVHVSQMQKILEDGRRDVTKKRTATGDHSPNLMTRKESSQESKQSNCELHYQENAFNDQQPARHSTASQTSTALQTTTSEHTSSEVRVEDENIRTSRDSSSQKLEVGHKESHPFGPSNKTLSYSREGSSQFCEDMNVNEKEQGATQVSDTDDTQGNRNGLRTSQKFNQKQNNLFNSPNGNVSDDMGNKESHTKVESPDQSAEADEETSESLSQNARYSNNSATPGSLEMETGTPCLFGNESWETPSKRMSQKRCRNQRGRKTEPIVEESKTPPVISKTLGLGEKPRKDINTNVNEASVKADFEGIDTLGDSQGYDVEHCTSSDAVISSAGNRKDLTSDTDPEGTQSFGTSQSVSVLQDLDFPSEDKQGVANDSGESESLPAANSNGEAKSGNSWAEPLPRKPRQIEHYLTSQEVDAIQRGQNSEKPHGSELTESDVIPPTPPVKPTTKQVFASVAPPHLGLSLSKMKPEQKDEANHHSERLVVKQKKRIKSLRLKSPRLQHVKDGDEAGAHCSPVGSEPSEASVSLLANHSSSPRMVDAVAKGSYRVMSIPFESEQLSSSHGRNIVNKSDVIQSRLPKDEIRPFKSRNQRKSVENVSIQDLDDSDTCISQGNVKNQISQSESQVVRLSSEGKSEVESRNSSPCSPVKQRRDDFGDSFDWSGTRATRKSNANSQDGSVTLVNSDNEEDKRSTCSPRTASQEDEGLKSVSPEKATNVNNDNCIIVDDNNGNSLSVDSDGDIPCNKDNKRHSLSSDDDEGDSSGDESLLKPVFLPKESRSRTNERSCQDDVSDNDEEEAEVFSQELIPVGNEDDEEDDNGDDEDGVDDGEITSSCKALDSTGASSATTFLSEAAASTQKMEVLRQDVEAMEREMEELRAYLAKTDENRDGTEVTIEDDDMDFQEDDQCDEPHVQPSLTPPPPLTPKSIPPMRQLSTPLKDVSRYLDQEGHTSDEESECEDAKSHDPVDKCELKKGSSFKGDLSVSDKNGSSKKSAKKRPLSPCYEDDGLTITTVKHRQDETPSPPRGNPSVEKPQESDDDNLIVIDDRDGPDSRTGSLLLVKRRKIAHDNIPKKSPVVSLLFTKTVKDSVKTSQSPRPVVQSKESSPVTRKSSPFIYSLKRSSSISPIKAQDPSRPMSHDDVLRMRMSRGSVAGEIVSSDSRSRDNISRDSASRNSVSLERVSHGRCQSPDLMPTKVKDVTNTKYADEGSNKTPSGNGTTRHLSFVATRLNRQQLAEARTLAETYGGKLASEFNNKTSHVIMATDENMQVTRHSYTMKYLLGLALGKWIVSHHWITACKQANKLVAEADYEVKGDSGLGQTSIPRKARTARNNKEPLLFNDFDVLCGGGFNAAVTKEQLSQLLKFCGARVCIDSDNVGRTEKGRRKVVTIDKETRDNVDGIKAICRQLNTKPVSLEWVTDSIANYKVQDVRDYIVEL